MKKENMKNNHSQRKKDENYPKHLSGDTKQNS